MSRRGARPPRAGDLAFAALLSVLAAASSAGLTGSNSGDPRSGPVAAVVVLTMVTPVVLARRHAVAVSTVIGLGALLNWLVVGDLVRCGTALPALFYVAFALGTTRPSRPGMLLGVAGLGLDLVCQAFSDPQLGPGVLTYMLPIAVGFAVAGGVWRHRRTTVARLRVETARLRDQRDATARLAVAADRARIATDLRGFVQEGVARIEAAASEGRERLADDPAQAEEAFVEIQQTGRTALTRMRDVLADLGGEPPVVAGAMLAQLDHLVAQASDGRGRLHVQGDPRLLPPSLELSAYRIVERLLESAADRDLRTGAPEVTVAFGPQELQLTVTGAAPSPGRDRAAAAVARERVAVHGGTLQRSTDHGRRTTVVRLPLAVARV